MFIADEPRIEKRRTLRGRCSEAVTFRSKDFQRQGGCVACDLSEEGIKISCEDFIPVNSELILQMKLERIPQVMDLTGQVVWAQRVPHAERYHIGIKFVGSDPLIKEDIRSYISHHQRQS